MRTHGLPVHDWCASSGHKHLNGAGPLLQVADEHGLEVGSALPGAGAATHAPAAAVRQEGDLAHRVAELRRM